MDNKQFWDRVAFLYHPIQEISNRKLYAAFCRCARPYIEKNMEVLELACGSGQLTFPLCGAAKRWVASDYSEKMLRAGKKRKPDFDGFCLRDATDLPEADGSYDLVLIGNALHILPEPEKAMAEIRRVLRPEGILLVPNFVYEGKVNRVRMWLTERVGFRTYHQWNMAQLKDFVESFGFAIVHAELLPGDPLPAAFLAARKRI